MPASLNLDAYLDALATAAARIPQDGAEAGWQATVPTCPDWTVAQLVAHQGMVHRWAAGMLTGQDLDASAIEDEGLNAPDPTEWFANGADQLMATLRAAPEDLDVRFFLMDAPAPRLAWARRQAHETTVHSVDALAAHLGSQPSADEVDLDPGFASDGIDELLTGFTPRKHQHLRTAEPVTVVAHATDTGDRWTLHISDQPVVTTAGHSAENPDTTWHGTATQLYLGLWNRGDEIEQQGRNMLGLWQERMRIEWSR